MKNKKWIAWILVIMLLAVCPGDVLAAGETSTQISGLDTEINLSDYILSLSDSPLNSTIGFWKNDSFETTQLPVSFWKVYSDEDNYDKEQVTIPASAYTLSFAKADWDSGTEAVTDWESSFQSSKTGEYFIKASAVSGSGYTGEVYTKYIVYDKNDLSSYEVSMLSINEGMTLADTEPTLYYNSDYYELNGVYTGSYPKISLEGWTLKYAYAADSWENAGFPVSGAAEDWHTYINKLDSFTTDFPSGVGLYIVTATPPDGSGYTGEYAYGTLYIGSAKDLSDYYKIVVGSENGYPFFAGDELQFWVVPEEDEEYERNQLSTDCYTLTYISYTYLDEDQDGDGENDVKEIYSDTQPTEAGYYKVVAEGKGDYSGSTSASFEINDRHSDVNTQDYSPGGEVGLGHDMKYIKYTPDKTGEYNITISAKQTLFTFVLDKDGGCLAVETSDYKADTGTVTHHLSLEQGAEYFIGVRLSWSSDPEGLNASVSIALQENTDANVSGDTGVNAPGNTGNTANTSVPAAGTTLQDPATKAGYKVTEAGQTVEYTAAPSKKATSASIPDTVVIDNVSYKVTSIAPNAFKNCKKLKKATIGANIRTIGKKAFFGCKSLKTVTVKSKSLTKIGGKAFKGILKNAKVKVPKAKLKAYKKLLKKAGLAKSAKVKG